MGDKLLLKLNIYGKPIANKYCEGKMKRTLKRRLKDLKSLKRKRLKKSIGLAFVVLRGALVRKYVKGLRVRYIAYSCFSRSKDNITFNWVNT